MRFVDTNSVELVFIFFHCLQYFVGTGYIDLLLQTGAREPGLLEYYLLCFIS